MKVRDVMTWVVATTSADASIVHAALVMTERWVGSLPVVDNGKLVGTLTERDVLRVLSRERGAFPVSPGGVLW